MALIKCPNCGKEYSEHAEKCPRCGLSIEEAKELHESKKRKKKKTLKIVIPSAISAIVIVSAILWIKNYNQFYITGKGTGVNAPVSSNTPPKNTKIAEFEAMEEVSDDISQEIIYAYTHDKFFDYSYLRRHCSAKLLQKLKDFYEYGDDGLAIWLFRSGAQDCRGLEPEPNKIIKIAKKGNSYYYEGTDGGWKFINILNVNQDGLFDDIESYVEFEEFEY